MPPNTGHRCQSPCRHRRQSPHIGTGAKLCWVVSGSNTSNPPPRSYGPNTSAPPPRFYGPNTSVPPPRSYGQAPERLCGILYGTVYIYLDSCTGQRPAALCSHNLTWWVQGLGCVGGVILKPSSFLHEPADSGTGTHNSTELCSFLSMVGGICRIW